MSDAQNLAYSAVQVLHNFGAVATVGGSFAALLAPPESREKLAWLAFAGWATQAVSGSAFGLTSYFFYHRFPDISGIAMAALAVKILCVAFGFLLVAAYLLPCPVCQDRIRKLVWPASTTLAATALTAAAFLRWFA
ncbi:hypothetical protein FGKAn22_17740 [Ferrigenium kumadai]|uniref:Uncharacterized protein n=1 Tax=Ferrigenium kumadai TaxID=1682490 RepID=A0AAN1T0L6_9PROT|nr:hypothetical protein [Ferrigenium kumadai]BBJ00082.1 hypothetical protein FGKAn22_17740 [Ferrigenium kumadai]